jgi:hypothetical protein
MRSLRIGLSLLALSLAASSANADIQFETESTATQTIDSPLVLNDQIVLHSAGNQYFTIDPGTGFANVTSDFHGNDFATSFGNFSYDLYNTATTGTVTVSGGQYTVTFTLLFELRITSSFLAGVTFETFQNATFQGTVGSLPFPDGSVFGDPNRPNDAVTIFLKSDPNGILGSFGIPVGAPVGTSSDREVEILRTVPEPSAFLSVAIGAGLLGAFGLRKKTTRRPV